MTWLKGCGLGCAALVIAGIILIVVGTTTLMGPFKRAIDARSSLDERFPSQEAFTPAGDGAVAPDRLAAFLEVRAALAELCGELSGTSAAMKKLEEFDDQEEPPRGEVLRAAWQATRSAMGAGRLMGRYFETRNRALLEAEMGLGEYSYIYVVAHHDRLVPAEGEGEFLDGAAANRRIRRALRGMLERQLAAMPADAAARAALGSEVAAMAADPARLPWQDGLPEEIAQSLLPVRQRLDELFCVASRSLELSRNRQRAFGIESE
jgi:hypothetical protein